MMAPLGTCGSSSVNANIVVNINEVSTVAMAYALAGFATGPAAIASSGSTLAATDVANAFTTIGNLESLSVARSRTPGGNGTVPQQKLNTLANVLAACINSASASSPACSVLFGNALSGGSSGTAPTDTATAILNIAHNPGTISAANLFALQTAAAPFQPSLTSAPADLTLSISYRIGFMPYEGGLAADASGNIWIANSSGGLWKLGPDGALLSPTAGFANSASANSGVVLDSQGNVWTAANGAVNKYSSTGTLLASYSGGGPSAGTDPYGFVKDLYESVALDSTGNIWLSHNDVNYNYVAEYGPTGTPLSPSTGYVSTSPAIFTDIAIDDSDNIRLADLDGYIDTLSANHQSITYTNASGAQGVGGNEYFALDGNNNLWTPTRGYPNFVQRFFPTLAQTTIAGGGSQPVSVAIDGANNAFIISDDGTLHEITASGVDTSGSAGYAFALNDGRPRDVVDGSGNVWTCQGNGQIAQFIGLATPVYAPNIRLHRGVRP